MSDTEPSEVHIEPPSPPPAAAPDVPTAPRKTLEEWRKARGKTATSWLHDAACIAAGWTVAQRHAAEPLTYTEAEYNAGLAAAGDTKVGGGGLPMPAPKTK